MRSIIKYWFLILVISFFTNVEAHKVKIFKLKETIKYLKQDNNKLETQNSSLQLIKSDYQKDIELKGKYLSYTDPNSGWNSYYYFFADSLFILDYGDHSGYVGKWQLLGDSIIIEISKKSGKRGIGEPIRPEGGVPAVYFYNYKEYVLFCENFINRISLNWKDISRKISLNTVNKTDNYCDEFCGIGDIISKEIIKKFDVKLDGDYTFASEKYLISDDLNNYSIEELRIIRNEIYSRYGYIFKSKELQLYFLSKEWYKPIRINVDNYLSKIEESNIRLIRYTEYQLNK